MSNFALSQVGTKEAEISVSISYRIIELFSAGLYTSPNKALEELVANSYDAMANNVHLILPTNMEEQNAVIWVIDDGIGMSTDGFSDLWRIASSKKRQPGKESKERPPIGKFGIGKLATYVLANELTYICKYQGAYRAVTMDYSSIDPSGEIETKVEKLPVRILSEAEAMSLLDEVRHRNDDGTSAISLFGTDSPASWTVVAMANLKGLSDKLSLGRLRWILSTALPLSPQFNLFLNGSKISSSREKLQPLQSWQIGNQDKVAERQALEVVTNPIGVTIDGIEGVVHGSAAIFADSFSGDKADKMGRSHGIFVIVRGRLVNIDDALFGVEPLSHGAFNRFRMEIHADGLDTLLRSTREAVLESEGVKRLQKYISAKFYEARQWYDTWLARTQYEALMSTRINATSQSLSRTPLMRAIMGVLDGSLDELALTRVPRNLDELAKKDLIARLENDLISQEGLIKEVKFEPLGMNVGLAIFDVMSGCVRVNLLHPFYANYIEHYQNSEPFELLAVAEVLTEAYLIEEGIKPDTIRIILNRRDRFLRELVHSRQMAAPAVASYLHSMVADATGLEKALAAGLTSLGFEVSPIGGNNEPDGTAYARMGVRNSDSGERADYLITYDTKSTGAERIKAHTVGSGTIFRHREKYKAQYSLVVAKDFAGGDEGAATIEAKQQQITLMTIEDFARLVLVAATRQLGFTKLRGLFENCRASSDARLWIDKVLEEEVPAGPLPEILDAVWELQRSSPDPVKFAAVGVQLNSRPNTEYKYREKEIMEWLTSLRRLAGGYVSIHNDVVTLEVAPERILQEVRKTSKQLPEQFRLQSMVQALIQASNAGIENGGQ